HSIETFVDHLVTNGPRPRGASSSTMRDALLDRDDRIAGLEIARPFGRGGCSWAGRTCVSQPRSFVLSLEGEMLEREEHQSRMGGAPASRKGSAASRRGRAATGR